MSRRITGLLAGAAIALTAIGATAYAQSAPPETAGAMHAHKHATPEEHAQKLTQLLQLRSNQKAAALAFVTAMQSDRGGMRPMEGPRPATTPERLTRMEQMMAERQERMRAKIAATRTFYAQLDPAQQKAFDAMPMMMGKGGKHGGRKGHGMHHGGHDKPSAPPAS